MKILIIEDDEAMRTILREFVRIRAKGLPFEVTVLEAGDLETALTLLPEAEAVLCDGTFPDSPPPQSLVPRPQPLPHCNWQPVSNAAYAREIPFVLFTGDEVMVALASQHGTIAFSKTRTSFFLVEQAFPPIDVLLGALALRAEERPAGENPHVLEMDAGNGEIYDEKEKEHGKRKRLA